LASVQLSVVGGLFVWVPCGFGGGESFAPVACQDCVKTKIPRTAAAMIRTGARVIPLDRERSDGVFRSGFAFDSRIMFLLLSHPGQIAVLRFPHPNSMMAKFSLNLHAIGLLS
ncbi:MAG TPA: hypothetical protein VF510_13140, partial [Ktedonobacterales bacterium]